jgi:hypothetical protein
MISERTLKAASSPDIELHRSHVIVAPSFTGGLEIRHRLALANMIQSLLKPSPFLATANFAAAARPLIVAVIHRA